MKTKGLLLVFSLLFTALLAEFALRILGYTPAITKVKHPGEPSVYQPHEVLGWRNKPGQHIFPPYSEGADEIVITFTEQHARITQAPEASATKKPQLLMVGASFTQGWAVSDDENYPWMLNRLFPNWDVKNMGTGGYGTYQSLLVMEEQLQTGNKPKCIVYGFFDDHEKRNVASEVWLRSLLQGSLRKHIEVPYVDLEAGQLARHAPAGYTKFPLRERLALVPLIESLNMKLRTRERNLQRRKITQLLIKEMATLSASHDIPFAVALLAVDDGVKEEYIKYLKGTDINFVDIVHPLSQEYRVVGEGHPNEQLHKLWASELAAYLTQELGIQ